VKAKDTWFRISAGVGRFWNGRILADWRDACGAADAGFAFHGELEVVLHGLGQ
jgi:hypothetical protein